MRAPDGCPWDRKQTHASLRRHLLEECYEVLEALDEGDAPQLSQELGDLLLQIVLHAQIAAESGTFDIGDVLENINTKLVSRHPHIFGSAEVASAEEVEHNWEALKQEERGDDISILDSVPEETPALSYSQSVQRRVAQVGFDWEETEGVVDKLVEEIRELRQAGSEAEREREFGDLLFTLVNVARHLGWDAEAALRRANRRFCRRFARMEELCRQRGASFRELSCDEQNRLWEAVKRGEGESGE